MHNIFKGLALGLLGFIVWAISSFVAAISDVTGGAQPWFGEPLMVVSFFIMVGGPIIYWIIVPVKNYIVKHIKKAHPPSINRLHPVATHVPPYPPPGKKYCTKCGAEMPVKATFCPKCGAKQ